MDHKLSKSEIKELKKAHSKAQNSVRHYTPGAVAQRERRKEMRKVSLTKMDIMNGTYEPDSRSPSPSPKKS